MKKFRRNAHKLSTRSKPVRDLAKARKNLTTLLTEIGKGHKVAPGELENAIGVVVEGVQTVERHSEKPANLYTVPQILEAYAVVNGIRLEIHQMRLQLSQAERAAQLSHGKYQIPRTPTGGDLQRKEAELKTMLNEAYRMEVAFRKVNGLL